MLARSLSHRPGAGQMGVIASHANPAWSPDGRFIAFSVRGRNLGLPGGTYQACQLVLVLPASANLSDLDGIDDPESWKLKAPRWCRQAASFGGLCRWSLTASCAGSDGQRTSKEPSEKGAG